MSVESNNENGHIFMFLKFIFVVIYFAYILQKHPV